MEHKLRQKLESLYSQLGVDGRKALLASFPELKDLDIQVTGFVVALDPGLVRNQDGLLLFAANPGGERGAGQLILNDALTFELFRGQYHNYLKIGRKVGPGLS